MKQMTMEEMMSVNGGHFSENTDYPVSNEEANQFATDAIIVIGVSSGGAAGGMSAYATTVTTTTAVFVSDMNNELDKLD